MKWEESGLQSLKYLRACGGKRCNLRSSASVDLALNLSSIFGKVSPLPQVLDNGGLGFTRVHGVTLKLSDVGSSLCYRS